MKVIGLTGGVACGKTTVARLLERNGIPVIDTDAIAHRILRNDPSIRRRIQRGFGTLDRRKLRAAVFHDSNKRRKLEAILHPAIGRHVDQCLRQFRKRRNPPVVVVVVVPLLFEVGWESRFDKTVAVVSPQKIQIERLVRRDRIPLNLAKSMVRAQMSNREKARRADFVMQNSGSLEELTFQVWALARVIARC